MFKKSVISILFICAFLFVSCGDVNSASVATEDAEELTSYMHIPGEFDSMDTSIVTRVNTQKKEISFYNYDLEKSYTLTYDSITDFRDKYETAISPAQIPVGSVADIKFLKSGKLLTNLNMNPEVFSVSDLTGFTIDTGTKVFNYKDDSYKITKGTVLIAGDKQITLNELDAIDTVTITGLDTTIYSVTVTKGHGFLSLKGEEKLIGGFLDIDGTRIEKITENFRIPVKEGAIKVKVTKDGIEAVIETTVNKLEDTVIDLSDIRIEDKKTGKVLFSPTPAEASVYIDGDIIDTSKYQELTYGMHKLFADAEGYDSITRFFNVGEDKAVLGVTLEEKEKEEDEKKEEAVANLEGYFIFINSPSDVEVTLDGNYLGISPLSTKKVSGNHVISLRKNGYKTRSYNVVIDEDEKDTYLTFEELEKSEGEKTE